MNGSRVNRRLNDYLEDELAPRTRERLEAQLAEDPALRRELSELEATVALLHRLPRPDPPPALADSVMARVRAGEAEPGRWLDWLRRLTEPAVAVPLAVAFTALALVVGAQRDRLPGAEDAGPAEQVASIEPPARPAPQVAPDPTPTRLARRMQRLTMLQELARNGQLQQAVGILSGAGHPYAPSFAAHFESQTDGELALVDFQR